jgi:hypothetical protein
MRFSRIAPCLAGMAILLWSGLALAGPDCTCRYRGVSYSVSSCVCIDTGEGPRLACCGTVLNNTSWSFTDQACPTTSREPEGLSRPVAMSRMAVPVPRVNRVER